MLKQPPLDVSKIPDIAGGDSGTTVLWFLSPRISLGRFRDDACVDTSLLRHPGLVPGPWLAPGPIQKGRDVKITSLDVSMIPDKRFAFPGRRLC